jgi:hypothetical protein
MNSLLQFLFMNSAFRNGVFQAVTPPTPSTSTATSSPAPASSSPVASDPICLELAHIFARLQLGIAHSFTPSAFVELLKVKPGEQQDAEEYSCFFFFRSLFVLSRIVGYMRNKKRKQKRILFVLFVYTRSPLSLSLSLSISFFQYYCPTLLRIL